MVLSACRKSLFAKLLQVFLSLKSSEKLMIKNERHPSWVSFVTIFLPVALDFRVYRQSGRTTEHFRGPVFSLSKKPGQGGLGNTGNEQEAPGVTLYIRGAEKPLRSESRRWGSPAAQAGHPCAAGDDGGPQAVRRHQRHRRQTQGHPETGPVSMTRPRFKRFPHDQQLSPCHDRASEKQPYACERQGSGKAPHCQQNASSLQQQQQQ